MGYFLKSVDWLRCHCGIKLQIAIYLHAARCYQDVRKLWLRSYLNGRKEDLQEDKQRVKSLVLPESNKWLVVYQKLSTYFMIYCVIKNGFPAHIWLDKAMGFERPTCHCYLVGRFILYFNVNKDVSLIFCIFHLLWRSLVSSGRPIRLQMIQFLYLNYDYVQVMVDKMNRDIHPEKLQTSERLYLLNLMCYKVDISNNKLKPQVLHKLRPNRTVEAKHKLERHLTITTMATLGTFLALAVVVFPTLFLTQGSVEDYIERYPGCSPKLEEDIKRGSLSWTETGFTTHSLIASIFDIFENILVWSDSGFAITLVVGLASVLSYDLMFYWSQIHLKLKKLERRLRRQAELFPVYSHPETEKSLQVINSESKELKNEVRDIQHEIHDFFIQLRLADELVSDVLSASSLIWLVSMILSCYLCATLSNIKSEVRLIQFQSVVALLGENISLLALSRKVNRSYALICSIMALDRSVYKEKFLIILELYSRHSLGPYYTIFHQISYTSANFLTLAGWSFSAFVMAESFLIYFKPTVSGSEL